MTAKEHTFPFLNDLHIHIKYALPAAHTRDWHETKSKSNYALWILRTGTIRIEYKKNTCILHEGDAFFFYPAIIYEASCISEQCDFIFIHFDAVLGKNYHALHFHNFDGYISYSSFPYITDNLCKCFLEVEHKEVCADFLLSGALQQYLAVLMKQKYTLLSLENKHEEQSSLARLEPVFLYINMHIRDPVTIKELANIIHLSEKYFITFFKSNLGITPNNYIIQIKMKKALEYLYEHKYSVKEIAALVGYADVYSFSKSFKKYYGSAPSTFFHD